MLNTLRKVEDHENHVRWIYLVVVLNSEVYENNRSGVKTVCLD